VPSTFTVGERVDGGYSKAKNLNTIVKKFYSLISKDNDTGYLLGKSRDPVISQVS
jgi:hypothetical protein